MIDNENITIEKDHIVITNFAKLEERIEKMGTVMMICHPDELRDIVRDLIQLTHAEILSLRLK